MCDEMVTSYTLMLSVLLLLLVVANGNLNLYMNSTETKRLLGQLIYLQHQSSLTYIHWFLGQLFDRVDLIKPVSNVHSYVHAYICLYVRAYIYTYINGCTCVRTSVRSQKAFSISVKFGMHVEVDE